MFQMSVLTNKLLFPLVDLGKAEGFWKGPWGELISSNF